MIATVPKLKKRRRNVPLQKGLLIGNLGQSVKKKEKMRYKETWDDIQKVKVACVLRMIAST